MKHSPLTEASENASWTAPISAGPSAPPDEAPAALPPHRSLQSLRCKQAAACSSHYICFPNALLFGENNDMFSWIHQLNHLFL